MPRKHKDTFAAVTEDGRPFTLLEFEECRLDISSGPSTERVYGANTYQTEDGEDVNLNADGTFTMVHNGAILRRKA